MSFELTSRPQSWWRRTADLFREAVQSTERDVTEGRPSRAVILLAIPMMLEMSMESLFAIVDILFVAKLGAAAIAAVGLTEMLMMVLYAAAIGMTLSVTAMVSRGIGEKNPEAAAVVAGQSIWIAGGSRYTAILMGGSATVFYLFLLNAVGMVLVQSINGAGDTTTPSILNLICFWLVMVPLAWWLAHST